MVRSIVEFLQSRCLERLKSQMKQSFPSLLAVLLLVSRSAAQEYTLTDLGTLGGEASNANAINATGQIVGTAENGSLGVLRAFLWESGVMFDLGVLGGEHSSFGLAINNAGAAAGSSGFRGVIFAVNAIPSQVNHPFGGSTTATGINASGRVCGTYTASFNGVPYDSTFAGSGNTYASPGFQQGRNVIAKGINDLGIIVGTAQVAGTNVYEAFRIASGTETSLPDLGGPKACANAINANSDIVGYSDVLGSAFHRAFLYRADTGTTINLGTLARQSEAMALNSNRVAVGYSFDTNGVSRAVRFANGGVADLNRLVKPGSGWLLTIANGINDSGWIVGNGTNPQGKSRGFLLRPDLAPPTVRLAKGGTIRASSARFTVKGSAADNVFVKRIEYRVGNGRFVRAKGGSKWSFKATLRPGRNQIGVRAIDGAGNTSRITTLTLIRS